jgi:hypothetical protein
MISHSLPAGFATQLSATLFSVGIVIVAVVATQSPCIGDPNLTCRLPSPVRPKTALG